MVSAQSSGEEPVSLARLRQTETGLGLPSVRAGEVADYLIGALRVHLCSMFEPALMFNADAMSRDSDAVFDRICG